MSSVNHNDCIVSGESKEQHLMTRTLLQLLNGGSRNVFCSLKRSNTHFLTIINVIDVVTLSLLKHIVSHCTQMSVSCMLLSHLTSPSFSLCRLLVDYNTSSLKH